MVGERRINHNGLGVYTQKPYTEVGLLHHFGARILGSCTKMVQKFGGEGSQESYISA